MIAGYFWIQCQYGNFKGRTYFRPCKHAWLQMKIYGPKLEPRSKLGHEKRRALEPENSAESEHYLPVNVIYIFVIICKLVILAWWLLYRCSSRYWLGPMYCCWWCTDDRTTSGDDSACACGHVCDRCDYQMTSHHRWQRTSIDIEIITIILHE